LVQLQRKLTLSRIPAALHPTNGSFRHFADLDSSLQCCSAAFTLPPSSTVRHCSST